VFSLQALRRYREAAETCDRIIALEPDRAGAYAQKILILWFWRGDTAATRAILEIMPPPDDSADALVPFLQEVFERRYPEAIRQLAESPGDWISWSLYSWPKPLLEARVWDLLGDRERAAENYATSMKMLEDRLQANSTDPRLHSSLGYALAGLGRKEEAIRAGRHAVELVQTADEALRGPFFLQHLAFIYARVGEPEEALALIDRLLSMPHLGLSVRTLELDPWWDPLREHPRYAQLLDKHGSQEG
jgi:serine/threonine-protein kinase